MAVSRLRHELLNREKWSLLKGYLRNGNLNGVYLGLKSWTCRNLGLKNRQIALPPLASNELPPNPLEQPRIYAPSRENARSARGRDDLRAELLQKIAPLNAKVSVIIPCYNYGKYVKEAVDSALNQSHAPLEVLIVNDGSTDPYTLEILPTLENDRVHVVNTTNQGLSMARNNGVAQARGDYLVFLDADDTLDPDTLALMLYGFALDPGAGFVFPYQHFFGDQNLIWCNQDFNAYDLLWANHMTVCIMIRKAVFDRSRKYRPEMKYGYEDWEFCLSLTRDGERGAMLPLPIFNHRRHGRTMTADAHDKKDWLFGKLRDLNEDLYTVPALAAKKRASRLLISVIIPYYNSPDDLDETIASLKRQSIDDFEVILIDDGSTEPKAIEKLQAVAADGHVRVVRMEHRGLPAARNRGALEARGDYIMFLDSDDYIDPLCLEKLAIHILLNPQAAFAYPAVVHFGDKSGQCYERFDPIRLKHEPYLAMTCLIRRDVFLAQGGMDETMIRNFEDYDFWLRLVQRGYIGSLVAEPLFFYRRHARGNMERIKAESKAEERRAQMEKRHPGFLKGDGGAGVQLPPLPDPLAGRVGSDRLVADWQLMLFDQHYSNVQYDGYRRPQTPALFSPNYQDDPRTNILYMIPHMVVGGAEHVDLDILAGLPRDRFRVTLVVEMSGNHVWYDRFAAVCDTIYLMPNIVGGNEQVDAFLDYLLVSKNIDIVFNRNTFMGYRVIPAWRERHPDIRFVDLLHLHNFGEDWVNETKPIHKTLHRRYVSNADLARYAGEQYGCCEQDFRVIYCGADTKLYDPATVEKGVLRGEMRLPEDKMLVTYMGRMDAQKDPIRWVEAAAEINRRDKNVFFAMIGGGPLLEDTIKRVRDLGLGDYVHFCGYRSDIPQILADSNCLLMTSNHEGIPQVVGMALSMGVPVVSSDAGGTRECVNEQVGRILPLDATPGQFADAVLEVLSQMREGNELRSRCRRHIIDNFRVEAMQELFVREFESLRSEIDRPRRLRNHQIQLMHRSLW